MAISTDRFKVSSIRPAAHEGNVPVPQELEERLRDFTITSEDLQDGKLDIPDLNVKTYRLHHGGDGLVEVYWHGDEFVLDLEPVPEQVS